MRITSVIVFLLLAVTSLGAEPATQPAVDAFDEQAALNPPLISLDLQNASPDEVVEQLNKVTGIRFEKMVLSDLAGTQCTLSAKDTSLMEALRQIAVQAPFTYGSTPGGVSLRFLRADRAPIMPPITAGPLLIFSANGAPAATAVPAPKGPGISFRFASYADPRMMLVAQSIRFTSASDDHGNSLTISQANGDPAFRTGPGLDDLARINQVLWNATVTPPADPNSSITVKGQADLRVVTKSATFTVADPEEHLNEVIRLGGREISITRFVTQGRPITVNLGLSVSPPPSTPALSATEDGGSAEQSPIYFTLTDSAGQRFTHRVSQSERTILVRTPNAPYTITFTAPLKWKLLSVPLELKGLVQR